MNINKRLGKLRRLPREGVNFISSNLAYYICIVLTVCLMCLQQPVRGVFMDDLVLMQSWQSKESVLSFIWTPDTPYLRAVSNLFLGVGLGLIGAHTEYMWLWTAFVGCMTAMVIFHVFRALVKSTKLAFLGTIVFVVSRFGYYAYGQYMGVMELCATMMAAMVLYHTQCVPVAQKPEKHVFFAIFFSVLAILSHERYLSLLVLVIIAALLAEGSWKKRACMACLSLGSLIAVFALRITLLEGEAFRGTAGVSILETFDLKQALTFVWQGILYLFGFNTGEPYLAGYNYVNLPKFVLVLLVVFWLCILLFIWWALRNKQLLKNWKQYFLAVAFVGGTLVVGCVTFRLELRWLYTAYVGFIFICIKLMSECEVTNLLKRKIVPTVLFACLIVVELFYHGGYPNIYFWHHQNGFNQIYEEVILENDHKSLEGKRIVIITQHLNPDELTTFFRTYAVEQGYGAPDVLVYTSLYDYDHINTPADMILTVEWINYTPHSKVEVKDITSQFNQIYEMSRPVGNTIRKAAQLAGFSWWEGWEQEYIWSEKTASMRIATGETGTAKLTGKMKSYNIPNNLSVYFNNELIQSFPLNSEDVDITFVLPANSEGILRLELDSTIAPYDVGESDDRRSLGICIYELIVE